jgi:hypothetical protein
VAEGRNEKAWRELSAHTKGIKEGEGRGQAGWLRDWRRKKLAGKPDACELLLQMTISGYQPLRATRSTDSIHKDNY